jgi:tetratricopeptide (TPR) repeat protein
VSDRGEDYDAHQLALEGAKMSRKEVGELEGRVQRNPEDIDARAGLLGYYFLRQRKAPHLAERHIAHIKWFIENRPEYPLAGTPFSSLAHHAKSPVYEQAIQQVTLTWQKHIESKPDDLTLLEHAAQFFLHDNIELAEKYLLRAKDIEPTNPKWSERLAHLYDRSSPSKAENALQEMERALSLESNDTRQFYIETGLAKLAFKANSFERAKLIAEKLLPTAERHRNDWCYGNAINEAHTILGRLALQDGHTEKAKQHLIQSAVNAKSPQTASFGPSMDLADALLRVGETAAVLQYLEDCGMFWEMGQKRLDKWRSEIRNGKCPHLAKRKR